jgi:hypothetical protein
MLDLLVMLLWAVGGFALGLLILGAVPSLRERPRYLMSIGAAILPFIFVIHLFIPLRAHLFGPDLLFLMTGVGMIVAGWEAEVELEGLVVAERRLRLRTEWELRDLEHGTAPEPRSVGASVQTLSDVE